jgi:hypothetical protein
MSKPHRKPTTVARENRNSGEPPHSVVTRRRLSFHYSFILVVTLPYHFIPTLAEYQPLVYSTLIFSPGTQTCYSKGEDGLDFFDEEF